MSIKEQIKKHVHEHRDDYIAGAAAGVVFAGITTLIMRRRNVMVGNAALSESDGIHIRPLTLFSNKINTTTNVVSVIEREGRGNPGYITKCLETGINYLTQEDAAKAMNVHPTVMSRHIRGVLPDANGMHFERIAA